MRAIADALFASESTRGRLAKVDALAAALRDVAERAPDHLAFATRFLTGTMLAVADDRVLGTGGSLVFEAACAVANCSTEALGKLTGAAGDLGTAVGQAIEQSGRTEFFGLSLADVESVAHLLASTGSRGDKLRALRETLAVASPLEARYVVRAILGEMRVGAKEGIVEDAIAKAFDRSRDDVRRAAGVVTDLGELAVLAKEDKLGDAQIVVGRPVGFMLATPIETARGADLTQPHAVEDKVDGIRAQAHTSHGIVRIFARGKGSVTAAFPDVANALAGCGEAILDGEIVVMGKGDRVRPFSALQPRLKKIAPDASLLAELPVVYLVYDLLYETGESLLALPFVERRARLEAWCAKAPPPPIRLHVSRPLVADAVDPEFDAARSRGYEGLVLKRLDAPYAAGVRGFSWLKVKKAFATLDVVIVAAERGHGKRVGVLSDYTFAVRKGDTLEVVGKAYNGLTDVEIKEMTARLEGIAIAEEKRGFLPVKPEVVLEVAFDGIQKSTRHASGYALRFPRINRIRDDKTALEADTVDTVAKLYESQIESGHREESVAKKKTKGRKSGYRPDIRQKTKQLKLFDD